MTEKTAQNATPVAIPRQPDWITCPECDTRWTGLLTCHCGACHRLFSSVRTFDIHRTGGRCNDPAALLNRNGELRLIPIARQHWKGWGEPREDTRWDGA
jgi:hypothetical protein